MNALVINECFFPADANCSCANCEPGEPALTLETALGASIELVAAIEAIEITEGHEWTGACDCGTALSSCVEVFDGCCSVECCALALLWNCAEEQDQSPRAVSWCVSAIGASFARARARAAGGA